MSIKERYPKDRKSAPRKHLHASGQRFNHFVLVRQAGRIRIGGRAHDTWLCLCDCGVEFTSTVKNIVRGKVSCGCDLSHGGVGGRYKKGNPLAAPYRGKYKSYQHGAKRRNLIFNLTEEQVYKLFEQNCYYCKVEPCLSLSPFIKNAEHRQNIFANGIDRINPSLGYTIENTIACCHICNRAKGDMMQEEFFTWVEELRIRINGKS